MYLQCFKSVIVGECVTFFFFHLLESCADVGEVAHLACERGEEKRKEEVHRGVCEES